MLFYCKFYSLTFKVNVIVQMHLNHDISKLMVWVDFGMHTDIISQIQQNVTMTFKLKG